MNEQTQASLPDAAGRIEEIFQAFEKKGAPSAQAATTFLFDLQGETGGRHLLRVAPDGVTWTKNHGGDADVRVKLSVDDFLAIADGTFDGRLAVASERIEIEGDLAAAEKLLSAIELEED